MCKTYNSIQLAGEIALGRTKTAQVLVNSAKGVGKTGGGLLENGQWAGETAQGCTKTAQGLCKSG